MGWDTGDTLDRVLKGITMKMLHLLGPSGSGKSTAMREVMRQLIEDMRAKSGTIYSYNGLKIVVLGNYKHTCGGLDTLKRNWEFARSLVDSAFASGALVLSEGYLGTKDTIWFKDLPVTVLCLQVTEEEALMGIAQRRFHRLGVLKPGDARYYRSQVSVNKKIVESFGAQGEFVTRRNVVERIMQWIKQNSCG